MNKLDGHHDDSNLEYKKYIVSISNRNNQSETNLTINKVNLKLFLIHCQYEYT